MPTYRLTFNDEPYTVDLPWAAVKEDGLRIRRMIQRRIDDGTSRGNFMFTNTFDGKKYRITWEPEATKATKPTKRKRTR